MNGPFELTNEEIDRVVAHKCGTYLLSVEIPFVVKYVGHSDDDLNNRLKKWVRSKYRYLCLVMQNRLRTLLRRSAGITMSLVALIN